MRKPILTLIAMCVWSTLGLAQSSVDSKTPASRQTSSGSRVMVPGVRGKAPIIGQVYIGELAPDFVLDGSRGSQEQLSKHRGQWVLLAFGERYRDLAGFNASDSSAHQIGAHFIGVAHEKQRTLTSAARRKSLGMLMLADVTGEVSATYGLFDWGTNTTQPGFFVIDAQGIVRLAIVGRLFPPDQMLELLRFETGSE